MLKANSNCIGTKGKGQSKQKHLKVTQSDKKKKKLGKILLRFDFTHLRTHVLGKKYFVALGLWPSFLPSFQK